jgi:ATP-dependent helicase/DNAse subunit B
VSLSLVLGPANSAKAGEVLGAYALASERDALLVVPTALDVAHYERELAAPGVTLGRVLTFSGLIDEIGVRMNFRPRRVTALQRERILRRAISSLDLQTLGDSAAGGGFTRAAGRLIVELRQQRVPPARFASALRTWAAGAPEALAYSDELSAIYRRYVDELGRYGLLDAESFAWGALDALREQPTGWGATPVFFYGFDDLTPIELDTIETLSRHVHARVTVSLTYEPDRPALAARATVVEELRSLAQTVVQLPALDDHYEDEMRVALHHLERHLFEPDAPVLDPGAAVTLMEAGGERAEAELVAAAVAAALAEGVPADELVVVCRSLAGSGERFEQALRRYGIAATSARRVPLDHTALGRALLALVRYALAPAPQRTVADLIAYLRHPGLLDAPDVVDQFEADMRRSARREIDPQRPSAIPLRPLLEEIDQLRFEPDPAAVLPDHVRRLMAAPHWRGASLLADDEQLDAFAAAVVIDALHQIEELDDARPLSGAEIVELLEGVQVPAHGHVASEGAVLVSEPLGIRARRFRRVFVTGLCEGEFPSAQTVAPDPFLGDERRRELALASGLALPPEADRLERERYLLYACVSRATERVTFSYRSSDEDGNLVVASPFLDDVAALFGAQWRAGRRRRLLADVVWDVADAPSPREFELAQAFGGAQVAIRTRAARAPGGVTDSTGADELATYATYSTDATYVLSPEAMTHVRHSNVVSAGALEAFAACPVRWLAERQLDFRDLEPEPEPLTRGSVIHTVLEQVISKLGGPLNPETLPAAERVLHAAVRDSGAAIAPGQPAEVRAAILRGIEAELRRYLRYEAGDGCDWIPIRSELRFGLDAAADGSLAALELDDGERQILVSGVIDRVDRDPQDRRRALVRDYKSGARRDTWPGARWRSDDQLQVAIYMIAVERLLGMRAVAGFYQPLSGVDLRPRGVYEEGAEVGVNVVTRDAIATSDLRVVLTEIEAEAVALGVTLRAGELTPCPETCTTAGACRYPGICWANDRVLDG